MASKPQTSLSSAFSLSDQNPLLPPILFLFPQKVRHQVTLSWAKPISFTSSGISVLSQPDAYTHTNTHTKSGSAVIQDIYYTLPVSLNAKWSCSFVFIIANLKVINHTYTFTVGNSAFSYLPQSQFKEEEKRRFDTSL